MSGPGPKPTFATNRAGERVADAINARLGHLRETWKEPYALAIATAYFNPGGYGLLAEELDHPSRVRFLLGAEPEQRRGPRRLKDSASPARAEGAALRRALEGHVRSLAQDRDLLGFTIEADVAARRLVDWLRSGKVEVRRLEDGFLHGKAFVVTSHRDSVIAGSSNFTSAGLATNIELNLGQYDPPTVEAVAEWFDDLWARAKPYDLARLYAKRFERHAPYFIYLRMLWERYGAELAAEAEARRAPRIHLTKFQDDGLWRAQRILEERHGVLIADEVGLGKTFLAGELIRQKVEDHRQRVLVVAPATLRDGPWRKFIDDRMLSVKLVSFEQLAEDYRLNPEASGDHLGHPPKEFAMVVIDEAHYLRNPSTQRAQAVRNLLAGTPPKDLVLVTATPVNNSLWDLHYLLSYFLKNDAAFADVGIHSMHDHFAAAMAMNPDDLSPTHLFDILDAVAVRRTRNFVRRYYPNDTVKIEGEQVVITFPTPRVLKVDYDLDSVFPGIFDRFARALDGPLAGGSAEHPDVLTLARYAPSRYRKDGEVEAYELQLAGLLRSGLLKRFESSAYAFARTCRKMVASHHAFLGLLAQGKIATGRLLGEWIATDSDDLDEVEEFLDAHAAELEHAEEYDIETLEADVRSDRVLLSAFATEAERVDRSGDPKLATIVEELADIAAEAGREGLGDDDVRDKRKVLIFSYFADTVDWVHEHLVKVVEDDERLASYRGRIASLSGTDGSKADVLYGFAPRTTDAPEGRDEDRYDIVVATDVLAEGVNLQQCRHIINYDLPWNPMRLVQRHGRIDRIGSPHSEVFLRCVFPDARLDDLLGLEERLHRKLKQAAASIGVGEVLPGSETGEIVYSETREEVQRLREGDVSILEQAGAGRGVLSGEEYRQELRKALQDPSLERDLIDLPWGSGSGMARAGTQPGYVFCARVGDHATPIFRYVGMGDPAEPSIIRDTLSCLAEAKPDDGPATDRVLGDDTYRLAFDAWKHAKDDIVSAWNLASDPANLQPKIPKAMHDAAELVRNHLPPGMTVEDVDELVGALQAPYAERIVRAIRNAMAVSDDPAVQAAEVALVARDQGLEPSPPPEPLPEIEDDDVHLVCWLAIVPRA